MYARSFIALPSLTAGAPRGEDAAPAPPLAQAAADPKYATYAEPSTAWHLYGGFGFGAADGKYGDVLEKPLQWEIRIAKQSDSGKWRFGAGLQFGSMDPADDPNIDPDKRDEWLAPDKEWARLETSIFVRRVFSPQARLRPYAELRLGIERIHPRSVLFYNKPPEGLEPGDSPTYAANGVGGTIQAGFEYSLGKTLSLDVSAWGTYYKTGFSLAMMSISMDSCVSNQVPIDASRYRELVESQSQLLPSTQWMSELAKLDGFPVRSDTTTSVMGKSFKSWQEIVSSENQSAPAGTYAPPADYAVKAFDPLGQGARPRRGSRN